VLILANLEHLAILNEGLEAWSEWRILNPKARPDLCLADLRGALLGGADLSGADLSGADLSGADLGTARLGNADLSRVHLGNAHLYEADLSNSRLRAAYLGGAHLVGADLHEANLSDANLTNANLCDANLKGADLGGVNLSRSWLARADFSGAIFSETIFGQVNLSAATGLESCVHAGPSVIDFRTLARSKDLPLAFLRGCGLPETLIEYLPSLLNQPIQFYSCFISYSTKDQDFAARLHADLQDNGVRCWFAPHNVQGGKKLHEQIDEAIRMYDRLLLILSDHSMNSEWVWTEIAKARKRERAEKRRMLFPVRLVDFNTLRDWECFDGDVGKDSAREIREFYIPDFSNWKDHDSYQREFEKLLRDLKSESELSPP